MKTSKEVDPAEMNGSGKPVGGIEPTLELLHYNFLHEKRANLLLFFCNIKSVKHLIIPNA